MKITSLVLRKNLENYPEGHLQGVDCENMAVLQTYWRVPITGRGTFNGNYRWVMVGVDVAKPTVDSVKALHLKDRLTQDDYYVALTDGGSVDDFVSRCNACCDDVTAMPTVVIPEVVTEEIVCPDEDDNRNFFTITRALEAGEIYDFQASIDGELLTPATQDEGFASLAAFETWADANWGPNTFAVSGTKVTMTSATAESGSIATIIKKLYESNAPAALGAGELYTLAATINGVVLTPIVGIADAPLADIATAANADATYASYGKWSVVAGKVRLVSGVATSAALVVTIS